MKNVLGVLAGVAALGAGAYMAFRRGGSSLSGAGLRGESEAHELLLFCENDGDIYRQQISMIEKNLKRRLAKGTYDHEKSKKLWMYAVENCAKKYNKEFGDERGLPWHKMFSMEDRRSVATKFADSFRDEHAHQAKRGITPGGRSR